MPDGVDDYVKMAKLVAEAERAELRHAFNNSMAGRETGRMDVAFVGEAARKIEAEKRRKRLANLTFETALQTLLADPVYRARWERFGTFLATYATVAQTALERAIEASTAAKDALHEALENAHMLNGRPVFETEYGRFVYADSAEIDPGEAGDIVMSGDAVSYEDYQALENRAAEAERAIEDIYAFQEKLDAAEAKRTDPDNPYESPEEMDAEQKLFEQTVPQAIEIVLEETRAVEISGNRPSGLGSLSLRE